MPRRTIRLSAETEKRVRATAKLRGFANPSVFLRAAIDRELKGCEEALVGAEERLATTAEQIRREILGLKQSQQALFAFVDSLAKVLLTCVPEPDGQALESAVARAQVRHARLLKTAGQAMGRDSGDPIDEIVRHGDR